MVTQAVIELGYMDPRGQLQPLDSVSVIDLVTALEQASGLQFPMPDLRPEHFESLQSVSAFMEETATLYAKKAKKTA